MIQGLSVCIYVANHYHVLTVKFAVFEFLRQLVYLCMCLYVSVCVGMCTSVRVCVCVSSDMLAHQSVCQYLYMCTYVCVQSASLRACARACVRACVCVSASHL